MAKQRLPTPLSLSTDAATRPTPFEINADMTPAQYEEFLANLYRELLAKVPLGVDVFLHRRFSGNSGQSYDIDLGFQFEMAGVKYLTLVEAKYYSDRLEVGDILAFSAKLQDINAQKGIVITKVGFQAGALRVAASRRIALVVCNPSTGSGLQTILAKPGDPSRTVDGSVASMILREVEHLMSPIANGDTDE